MERKVRLVPSRLLRDVEPNTDATNIHIKCSFIDTIN